MANFFDDWEEIVVETEDGEVIASISDDGDEPVICKKGYRVRLIPTGEDVGHVIVQS